MACDFNRPLREIRQGRRKSWKIKFDNGKRVFHRLMAMPFGDKQNSKLFINFSQLIHRIINFFLSIVFAKRESNVSALRIYLKVS
jgi:hypothetical protein